MAINLKTALDSGGQQELTSILASAKESILKDVESKRSQANLKALETKLHRIFYPVGTTAISVDYYNRRTQNSTQEQLNKVLENFDFEKNTSGHHSATTGISPNTLSNAMGAAAIGIKTILEQIGKTDSVTDKEHLESLLDKANSLIKDGERILQTAERTLQFGQERIQGTNFQEALKITNQLTAFSKALSIPDFVTPQEAGILFEEALALTNFVEDSKQAVISDAMRELATTTTQFGSKAIKRGSGGMVSYTVDASLVKPEEVKSKGFKLQKGNASITYSYNPSSARQGKMDVQLQYHGDTKDDYRVSAKRWSHGAGDLGETSIDAGIQRAAGQSVAEAYKLAVLTPNSDHFDDKVPGFTAAQNAHDFATIALKSDIAMGLNQGKDASGAGYANILVVDTGSAIKVKDLATIVTKAEYELSKYNPAAIQSSAVSVYNSMKHILTGRSQSYYGMMTSVLNKMKVTINLSVKKS